MTTIDAMMVCLDLSDIDEKLVDFARSLCERLPVGKVYFVHNIKVAELSDDFRQWFGNLDLASEVEGNINDIIAEHFGNAVAYEVLVGEEPNTEVLLADLVKRYRIKLAVLGKKMSHKSTGSLGTKLLQVLPCSVLVFPETASVQIKKVLLPLDFSATSVHALRLSQNLASHLGLQLEILHVYRLPTQYFPLISEERAVKKAEEIVKERFAALQRKHQETAGVPYTLVRAANKSVAERIRLHLGKGNYDLLVLGLKGSNPLLSLRFGSVPKEIYNMDLSIPLWLVYSEEVIG
ncbi:universal stress protein [Hymenobacter aerilatus]|uniref:Universal stress protein n=1 Tax=Hymenobacter aerilatus TaxID=2932251 RepID=A0A8T9SWD8_9BACT|nr:universal stress protein [Hymenobacter aerilatus]UOR04079.1 universal stress protein [Hymenobacter aerilatus]